METGIIIQARKGSTRLPNKMVLPLYENKGVLELLIEKLIKEFPKQQIILATTTNNNDDELAQIASSIGINTYRGSENNVLDRFIQATKEYQLKNVIRICADNPFLDIPHIHILIEEIEKNKFDYVSYRTDNGLPTIKSHLGLFTEAITTEALLIISTLTKNKLYLEHVTNYAYEHQEIFSIHLFELPSFLNNTEYIRLTLDTEQDMDLYKLLCPRFINKTPNEIINYIREDNDIRKLMSREIERQSK